MPPYGVPNPTARDNDTMHSFRGRFPFNAPDLGRYVVEFAYGEIYHRPVLDLRQRQLVTISALTTVGGAEPQGPHQRWAGTSA